MFKHVRSLVIWSLVLSPFAVAALRQSSDNEFEAQYLAAKVADPVTQLISKIQSGSAQLTYEPKQGYLRSLLKHLDISPTSQILVFSKTSLQSAHISPTTPRALYFNDHAYVGWIPGAPYMEVVGIDPQVGPVFFLLTNEVTPKAKPVRQNDECLQCHNSGMTKHVPGLMARSVYAGPDGTAMLAGGSFITGPTSPMKERWGGWYVTGTHGEQRHMGNEVARGNEQSPTINIEKGANVTDLHPYFDVDGYLTPHSDIVALMVAEQQMVIQNLITKAGFLSRNALKDAEGLRKFGFSAEHVAETIHDRVKSACEPLVFALTGLEEPKFTSPIKGTSSFTTMYSASSPQDKGGHRLSELDLKARLLRYRCSPMIYSSAFQGLPAEAKSQVFSRIRELLSPPAIGKGAATLTILSSTVQGFSSQS